MDASVRSEDFRRPPAGTFRGHLRGPHLATSGDFLMAMDTISGRVTSEQFASVGNHAGQTTVWSDPAQRQCVGHLLEVVSARTSRAKQRPVSDPATAAMGVAAALPARLTETLPRVVSGVTFDRSQATTRVSNLGPVSGEALTNPSIKAHRYGSLRRVGRHRRS